MARPAAGRQIATLAAPPLQMDLAAASGALLALLLSRGAHPPRRTATPRGRTLLAEARGRHPGAEP